jgi:hypothetical protein
MGNPLFSVNISGIIKDVVGPGVLAATLTKFTPGTRTVGQLTGGTNPTNATYTCRGFIDSKDVKDRAGGGLVAGGTVKIVLIGDTINGGATAPDNGDHITIEGATYLIDKLDRDPAAATYTCVCAPV